MQSGMVLDGRFRLALKSALDVEMNFFVGNSFPYFDVVRCGQRRKTCNLLKCSWPDSCSYQWGGDLTVLSSWRRGGGG